MSLIGHVESVWRYPVKSMAGEELPEIYAGFGGVWGDRLFALKSSATPIGFPYLTGREAHDLLLYRPHFRNPGKAAKPANVAEAEEISPLLNPVAAEPDDFALDVETPSGEVLPVADPALLQQLNGVIGNGHTLSLLRSERAMTDCRPISIFSLQTAQQLGEEVGFVLDNSAAFVRTCTWISGPRGGSLKIHSLGIKCGSAPKSSLPLLNAIRGAR